MSKERHIRTIYEKFGTQDIEQEFIDSIPHKTAEQTKEHLDKAPHIGILYIPLKHPFTKLLNDFEEGDIKKRNIFGVETSYKKTKVIQVDENHVTLAYWDDHHRDIAVGKREHEGFLVIGNELNHRDNFVSVTLTEDPYKEL